MIIKIGNKPYELATKEEVMKEVSKQMESTKKEIFDKLYPVGSVYISLDATFNPNNIYNGRWELLKEGLFLEATQQIEQAGKEIEAGLPEIIGRFGSGHSLKYGFMDYNTDETGKKINNPFYVDNSNRGKTVTGNTAETFWVGGVMMRMSRAHRIYRVECDTVQPHSIRAFMWQRIA